MRRSQYTIHQDQTGNNKTSRAVAFLYTKYEMKTRKNIVKCNYQNY